MIKSFTAEMSDLIVIGGGLAGCEAAWQAAKKGLSVKLLEMRPIKNTPAHRTANLAEIICSNSLGSKLTNHPSGLLAAELRILGSLLLECAYKNQIPAGHALAVDREAFAQSVQENLEKCVNIEIVREEALAIPSELTIVASGPLTSEPFAKALSAFTGQDNLFFFDALAPIIEFDSINMEVAYWGSRYNRGTKSGGDYINCPFNTKREYEHFVNELVSAQRVDLHTFEESIPDGVQSGKGKFFEACLPVEVMAARGINTLAYGPLRPVGLRNPHTGGRPYAVVQLRQDNLSASLFNLVGFQTNLTYPEQQRVFRLIPGLENAEFMRFGQMHRNTYLYAPDVLQPNLQTIKNSRLFMAGQLVGVEGYLANIATGLMAGINASRYRYNQELLVLPETTLIGALCRYIAAPNPESFQPMKANYGLLPPLDVHIKRKDDRHQAYSERALSDLTNYLRNKNEL